MKCAECYNTGIVKTVKGGYPCKNPRCIKRRDAEVQAHASIPGLSYRHQSDAYHQGRRGEETVCPYPTEHLLRKSWMLGRKHGEEYRETVGPV